MSVSPEVTVRMQLLRGFIDELIQVRILDLLNVAIVSRSVFIVRKKQKPIGKKKSNFNPIFNGR